MSHELLAVVGDDAADADGGDRSLEGSVGQAQGRGSAGAGEDVGVVLSVVAHDPALDLDLVDESVREQGADRTVDHPHGQDLLLARSAFTLAEPARELAAGAEAL